MRRLLKLIALAGAGYALWRWLNEQGSGDPAPPTPVRPSEPAPPARSSSSNGGGASSGSPSKAELYERAKELGIEGRSKMSKQQLERAIGEASQ